ncbi:MAG: ComEC/Rec2 family competence protein, partial [Clostridia bacterium]
DALKMFQKKNLQAATSDNVAAFLYAMTFGDASEIPKEVRQNFAVTGAAHLFAVSGLHIGIIAAAVVFLLKKCKLNARWQVVITMPILIFFCWLCEFSPSSCRAVLMIFVAMVARARGLRNDMLSTISFSAILLLLFKPLFLFDISFQLSFFAVFGLIFIGAPLLKIFKEVLPLWLSKTLAATIGANIGLFPFMLIYFENLSLLFVFANLVAIPLVSLGFPIYLACSVIAAIPHMNFLLAGIGSLFGVVISVISIIAKVKFLKISIVAAWWMIAPHVVFLVFVSNFCMISSKPRVAVSIAASCVVALSCVLSMRGVIAPQTEIFTTMDAHGNGYVAVKSTYGNYLVLTDQTSFDGRGQVAEWLFENNIDTLDGVALCEAQNDTQHLERLLKGVNIKHIFARQPDIRLQKYAKSWQGGLVGNDKVAISFLDNRQLQIVFDGVVIAVLPNDYVGYDALKSDILFGENKNSYSKIEKYVVDDKNVANSKKFLSWGCLFTIKNGKIRLA